MMVIIYINAFNFYLLIKIFFCLDTSKYTIEYIEINDKQNKLKIKYVPNKYWLKSDKCLFISNQSFDQIQDYNKLIDKLNKEKLTIEMASNEKILLCQNSFYPTLSNDLRLKYNKFILNCLEKNKNPELAVGSQNESQLFLLN